MIISNSSEITGETSAEVRLAILDETYTEVERIKLGQLFIVKIIYEKALHRFSNKNVL